MPDKPTPDNSTLRDSAEDDFLGSDESGSKKRSTRTVSSKGDSPKENSAPSSARLNRLQREAAIMFANGCSTKEVAAKLGRSVPCIQVWRRMDAFIECVEIEQEKSLEVTRRELTAQYCESAREAFDVLRGQLGCEAYVAQNAARMIIDKFYNLADKTDTTSVEVRFVNMPLLGEAIRETRPADGVIDIVGMITPEG